jgi:hypothetical protein
MPRPVLVEAYWLSAPLGVWTGRDGPPREWRLQGTLSLARVFSKRLVDFFYSAAASFLARQFNSDWRFLRIARERLRRPTPTTIEQRVCCGDASVRSVTLPHFLEQALDRFGGMASGKLPDFGNPTRTAARVTRLARRPSSVRITHCLISACSEATPRYLPKNRSE